MKDDSNYLKSVRAQYEQLPYPRRDPEHEKKRLVSTWGDRLDYLNHFGFSGTMPLAGFRVLDAGAGSGDATIFLAEQLRNFGGSVVHLDVSEASIAVAKERARIRGLENIDFVHASLLDLPALKLGLFDYVTATGVLHHLDDPKAGLDALNGCLKDDGVLQIMVYARYGRALVYQMQALMRRFNAGVDPDDIDAQLAACKEMMAALKGRGWYEALLNDFLDVKNMGDVGVFDLFLHSKDRAYSIPELYDFIESSALVLHHYVPSPHRLAPAALPDSPVKARLLALDRREQQTLIELMSGKVKMHVCYATRRRRAQPSPRDEDMIPSYTTAVSGIAVEVGKALADPALAQLRINVRGEGITIPLGGENRALLAEIDGERTIGGILDRAGATIRPKGASRLAHARAFEALFERFGEKEWLLLRSRSLPGFAPKDKLQRRVSDLYSS
ncbi:MAG: class I SAM-dependent methyltransferase [Parvularculaceae bacterium]